LRSTFCKRRHARDREKQETMTSKKCKSLCLRLALFLQAMRETERRKKCKSVCRLAFLVRDAKDREKQDIWGGYGQ